MVRFGCLVFFFGTLSVMAGAQSLNIDVQGTLSSDTPSDGYAAAGLAGRWNSILGSSASNAALVDLAGTATAATFSMGAAASGTSGSASWTGDDAKLMRDFLIVHVSNRQTISLNGLLNGVYRVRLYGMVFNFFGATAGSNWTIGSDNFSNSPSGDWPGAHQLGYTYAMTDVSVNDGKLDIVYDGYFAGMQLEYGPQSVPEPFTMALMGGAAVAGYRRMRRRKA